MSIKALVENPHQIWKRNYNYWNFLLKSYEGGIDYTQADTPASDSGGLTVTYNGQKIDDKYNTYNLFKHKKERSEDYRERIQMSYYYNFCAPIIDVYTNHLFRESVIENYGNIEDVVEKRRENIDRKNSSIEEFRKELSEDAQIFGHIFVVTDMPKSSGEVNLAQRISNDQFPYFTIFYPTDVLNWALDIYGRPYWVLLRECQDGNVDPMNYDKDKTMKYQYRLWTRNEWYLYDSDYQLIESGTHPIGRVPIDIVYEKPSKKYRNFLGISAISDICFIARDVYNKCSELNEILRNQTFAFLTLQGKSADYDEVSVGTSKALLYPQDTNAPSFVSPPADNAKVLMDQIDRQVTKMFQLAKLEGGSASESMQIDTQSGVSKAYDFHETNAALAKKAGHMEDGELRLWSTFAKWEGKEFDGSIQYSRDFNVKDLMSDLVEAEKLIRFNMGEMFDNKVKEELIKKKFPRMPIEEVDKIIQESVVASKPGAQLRSRLPGVFNNNPIFGGNGGFNQ
jgi:hypothetical protein